MGCLWDGDGDFKGLEIGARYMEGGLTVQQLPASKSQSKNPLFSKMVEIPTKLHNHNVTFLLCVL